MHKPCSSSFRPTALDRRIHACPGSGGARKGRPAFHSLLVAVLFLGACAHIPGAPQHRALKKTGPAMEEVELSICAPCSRDEAGQWATDAERDVGSALKAANCYAFLVKTGRDKASRLSDAMTGRQLAESAAQRQPESGMAHYLYAYLTGLEAENDPLRGLDLVPVIEREARLASDLNPALDRGGPDRMLGELYLRAPGIPVSIGDVEKAIAFYRRALTVAPGCADNRLGLAEALLKGEEATEACMELHGLLAEMPPADASEATWRKALDLLKHLCAAKNAE
jgi:tetratricopeptide (TPR) repeat protein